MSSTADSPQEPPLIDPALRRMDSSTSVLEQLLCSLPHLRPQLYFKSSLTALSHAMEDQVLAVAEHPLVIASFQRERFYRQEAHRYLRISQRSPHVYVLAAPETSFMNGSEHYETIAFESGDQLSQEWHLVVLSQQYTSCLICREKLVTPAVEAAEPLTMDQNRRFEGVWTFDRQVSYRAAEILLTRIQGYRPDLANKIQEAKTTYLVAIPSGLRDVDPDPFAQRLITHLQAGQYKLIKAYRSLATKERQERLVNLITDAIRRSLHSEEIFQVAVQELGQAMEVCRCMMYRCKATDTATTVSFEFLKDASIPSLNGEPWILKDNPLVQSVVQQRETIAIADTQGQNPFNLTPLQALIDRWQIRSWLLVPILHQGRLLGMVELHHCQPHPYTWSEDEVEVVEAIATQLGVALIQAESYANLEDLNRQLEALERTRSNLIAITGHELRTPLSTIQICLESLASEPDMPAELRQIMLSTALTDAERMRTLIKDFLTLSQLESGRVQWHLEALALEECVDLAVSSIRTRQAAMTLPAIISQVAGELPLIRADGEWLVEVLAKLLDNACKFTEPEGQVTITAQSNGGKMLEITITDTGRGIEPNRLEVVFDRFYQEEGALRRTAGGTGLGLAICRQIVLGLGGQIWAESAGRDQGSQFHFTLPIAQDRRDVPPPKSPPLPARSPSKSRRSKPS